MTTQLSSTASVATYWAAEVDDWCVITTVDISIAHGADSDHHAILRFSSELLSGQSHTISVPLPID